MCKLILHHSGFSNYSEKIRVMMGYKSSTMALRAATQNEAPIRQSHHVPRGLGRTVGAAVVGSSGQRWRG